MAESPAVYVRAVKAFPRSLLLSLATSAVAVALGSSANAQRVVPVDTAAPTPTTPVPVGAAGALPPAPPSPVINDPMLAPPPPAAREIASWGDAVSLSRARSTDIGTALAEVRRAEAQSRTALAGVLPAINGTATAPHQFITRDTAVLGRPGDPPRVISIPQSDYVSGNISLTLPVVNVQAWHNIKSFKENEKAARLSADEIHRGITLGVAAALVGVVAAERVAELNRNGLRGALERRELTARKRALGVGTGLDVLRGDQDVSAARAAIVTGDETLRKAREALGLAVGMPEQVGVAHDVNIDAVAVEAERTCPRLTQIEERADVAAARQRLLVAERNIGNVERSFLPTLSAQSTFATTTAELGNTQPPTTWNVSAALSVPIWDGGARYGTLRNARAVRDQSSFALEAERRTATVEVAQARRSVTVADASLAVARQAQQQASEVDRLTLTAYRAGQGTSLELVIAAAALRQADIQLAIREFELVRARLDALFALARCPGSQ